MKKLKAVIVEDENKARETLKVLLASFCPEVELVGDGANVRDGVNIIDTYEPDLVFLDIEMRSGTGFDLLKRVKYQDFDIVFTTAYQEYALKAIKAHAADYLLKPIDPDELKEAVKIVAKKREREAQNRSVETVLQGLGSLKPGAQAITLHTHDGMEFVKIQDILRCEASGSYTSFHLVSGQSLMISKNIGEFEAQLYPHGFFRVHQSHMVNMALIRKYVRGRGQHVVLSDGSEVEVSHRRREEFLEAVKAWQQQGG